MDVGCFFFFFNKKLTTKKKCKMLFITNRYKLSWPFKWLHLHTWGLSDNRPPQYTNLRLFTPVFAWSTVVDVVLRFVAALFPLVICSVNTPLHDRFSWSHTCAPSPRPGKTPSRSPPGSPGVSQPALLHATALCGLLSPARLAQLFWTARLNWLWTVCALIYCLLFCFWVW